MSSEREYKAACRFMGLLCAAMCAYTLADFLISIDGSAGMFSWGYGLMAQRLWEKTYE